MEQNPAPVHSATPTGIFDGNIHLHAKPALFRPEERFAEAFHNSSRKTLRYIPPKRQNGEVIVRTTLPMIQEGSKVGINGCWLLPRA
ncbi:UNVERIFIED_CONTAM: hypothetical protein Slati_2468800 [Sesamum latifolium]|uniref:Uncharacterized protein n=1 Tax=Sesamum latifolium TaxID=2727402 RepID=A0AAW2WDT1_9LAMI